MDVITETIRELYRQDMLYKRLSAKLYAAHFQDEDSLRVAYDTARADGRKALATACSDLRKAIENGSIT